MKNGTVHDFNAVKTVNKYFNSIHSHATAV